MASPFVDPFLFALAIVKVLFTILFCYAIGSFSPSHFLGRLKGVELRKHGTKNLGTSNALFILGKAAAMITLLVDVGKGAAAVAIALIFGLPSWAVYLCALAAILGHVFPFYLRFKGGKGVATCIGVALALTVMAWSPIIQDLPFQNSVVLFLVAYITIMMCWRTITYKKPEVKPVRKLIRLAGLLFPLVYFWWGREAGLWTTGTALALALSLDAIRLTNKQFNMAVLKRLSFFAKKKEEHTISTTTALLISLLASIALFDSTIVLVTSAMFIVSDAVAEIFGKSYGKHSLVGEKTVEGTAAGLAANVLLCFVLYNFLSVNLSFLLGASVLVTAGEAVSGKVDDNLTTILVASFILQTIARG